MAAVRGCALETLITRCHPQGWKAGFSHATRWGYHPPVRRPLSLLPLLLAPCILLRGSAVVGHFPGQSFGEGWGRLFAAGQVARWLDGSCPVGWSDLLAHPDGMAFWPVDPLTTLCMALLQLLGGGGPAVDAAAMSITMALLLISTGLGAWLLARMAGASPAAAGATGLVLQLHPFLLRSAADSVMEVLALGPVLLLMATLLHAWRGGGRGAWSLVGLAMLGTALTSPYYAVYATLLWALLGPLALWRRRWRPWATGGAVMILVAGLAAAPLLLAESGEEGRLADHFGGGGMRQAPSAMVVPSLDGSSRPRSRELRPVHHERPMDEGAGSTAQRAAGPMLRLLHRFPGGIACTVCLILGLTVRRSRPLALLALLLFVLGSGPSQIRHLSSPGAPELSSMLQELLQALPLTDRLGNAQRMTVLYVVPVALAGGIAVTGRRWLTATLGVVALLELALFSPDLRLPTTHIGVDQAVLDAVDGPLVTFPLGDPPAWNPEAPPKRSLYLATEHGQPVASSFGRRKRSQDEALIATLSAWSAIPITSALAHRCATSVAAPDTPDGFTLLLLLHESLDARQLQSLQVQALSHWGPPLVTNDWGSVYRIGPMP